MAGKGIVIQITADPATAKAALEQVREQMRETASESERGASAFGRFGSTVEHGVPPMAAASAALRALEGNFTNNIRAGERFLTMLPGVSEMLASAFPAVGAAVLATALVRLGTEAYNAIENIVELKGALEGLGEVDITVAKKLDSNADAIERSMEQSLEATQGHVAALKQRLKYESGKPIDLSELFYDKKFSGLKDNIKTNYEDLYKSVAPDELPAKLSRIRNNLSDLKEALRVVKSGEMGAFVPKVEGYGPTMAQDPEKYYEARIKAAGDVEKLLSSEAAKREAAGQALRDEMNKPAKGRKAHAARSDNGIADAQAALVAEQARAEAAAIKVRDEQRLAELENQHKLLLVSDQEYYAEKFDLQNEMFDAEEAALQKRQATLQQLQERQKGDKLLHRDKDGNSAEELRTARELVSVQEQLGQIALRRAQAESTNTTDQSGVNQVAELANLRAAAELEKQRGDAISAQIALMRAETDLEVKRLQAQGASPQAVAETRALEQRREQMLQIQQIQQQISDTEDSYKLKVQAVQDAESKGRIGKVEAEQRLNDIRLQEAAALPSLIDQYQQLASILGGDFTQKAAQLQAQLENLSHSSRKGDAEFGKTLTDGVTKMADAISEQTLRGKTSFRDMAKEIEADAIKLALKLAEQKLFAGIAGSGAGAGGTGAVGGGFGGFLSSFFSKLTGAGGLPGFADGGQPDGPSIVGEKGPELWMPPQKGGTVLPNGLTTKLAEAGGGARTPNVTTNIVNNSSQPVSAQPSQVSYDAQMKSFVIHTFLEDMAQNGATAQAMSGMRNS